MNDRAAQYASTRRLIHMALRRGARGTGSSPQFLNRRTAVLFPNLQLPLRPGTWVLVGGLATRAYMPERMTQDVDILIRTADEQTARDAFRQAGYTFAGPLAIGGFSVVAPDGLMIDVLTSSTPWLETVLTQPSYDVAGYPVIPRPYLMLMKMMAGRPQDWTDVQRMLRDTPTAERQSTRTVIMQYLPELAEDYDSLITLADVEFGDADDRSLPASS